jgi:hypothetical protein
MVDEKTSANSTHLIHGLYAKDILLPWEDREEFIKLHEGLKIEYFPNGPSEEACVFDLAQAHWQKGTLSRLRTATVLGDHFTQEILATGKKSWAGIRQGLRKKAKHEQMVLKMMGETFTTAFSDLSRLAKKINKDPTAEKVERLQPLLEVGIELIAGTVLPMLDEVRKMPDSKEALEKNYLPDHLEKIVRLEASIDSRITKTLARLVAIKEFKRTPAGNPPKQLTRV